MPRKPRIAIAKPRVEGGKARPPVKWNGRLIGSVGLRREEDRKTSQREAKPPIWKSKIATVRRTRRTFGVVKTTRVEGRVVEIVSEDDFRRRGGG